MENNETDITPKLNGRYRLNDEDKARPVPLKLHQKYLDKLEYLPGKNNAEKIRALIDRSAEWQERERRQVKEIRRLIPSLYRQARLLVDPKITQDRELYKKEVEKFLQGLRSFETVIEILHFDIVALKEHLDERDIVELDIVFNLKMALRKINH